VPLGGRADLHAIIWGGKEVTGICFVGEFVADITYLELDPFIYGPATRFHLTEGQ
jgi:hypothetical protein